ncbi:hypothetical protein HN51_013299 [Arachis hypogaea]|uniref:GDSL esterase/lipase At5g45960 n=1 Tax=Arachis hypogaea TaxID=3818 RepID=UPI000DECA4DC|nr:GDSL esterase/lipase At5g45960 [Arachis hypogaea]QHO58987.1 GDSL esterase/lipase [Arachis hypogaea]
MAISSDAHRPLHQYYYYFIFMIYCLLCFTVTLIGASNNRNKVSALYVFGDSTVDPGNNNYIRTAFKSNFEPYGRDFANQVPTGRFTNGKLGTDFIAWYLGLKEFLPPYLDPNLTNQELITGVSFASAGSGYDPLTPTLSNVISIGKQLEHFKEYKKKLEKILGKQKTENHMKNAIFFISAGTNDFVINYFTLPIRRKTYSLIAYHHFLLQHVQDFIQELLREGARKLGVVGLPPMGCLPIMITFNSNNALLERGCVDMFSSVARNHNLILQNQLNLVQLNSSMSTGAKIYYVDIYEPLSNMIHGLDDNNGGFDEVDSGCCGSGYIEAAFLCNRASHLCSDASKYVFWDSIHPTEKAYYNMYLASRHVIDALVNV